MGSTVEKREGEERYCQISVLLCYGKGFNSLICNAMPCKGRYKGRDKRPENIGGKQRGISSQLVRFGCWLDSKQSKHEGSGATGELHAVFLRLGELLGACIIYEIDHCTALGPCSTGHMTPTSLLVCVERDRY